MSRRCPAACWSHARVNLGTLDKTVHYEGMNYRAGGQLTFGDTFCYFCAMRMPQSWLGKRLAVLAAVTLTARSHF